MRKRRRSRPQMAAIDQINVTPLLDLTFLLLIAFMITVPLMEYGTQINAPEMNSDEPPKDNFTSISLTKAGTIIWDKEEVTRQQLIEKLAELKQSGRKVDLLLRADGERSYKDVIELMAEIRRNGFKDVILMTQAERK